MKIIKMSKFLTSFILKGTVAFLLWSESSMQIDLPPLQNEFPEKCLEDMGCFRTGAPYYHPVFRPLSLLPFDKENIRTKFLLFTPQNPIDGETIHYEDSSLWYSTFNPRLDTKIIIHGFVAVPERNDFHYMMKDAMISCGYYNVIIVDWSDSNQPPYAQAVANARVVGAQLAKLICSLRMYFGTPPESVHIIGHSLGAHLSGWAGERIQNLGRITGLDPAGPYFYNAEYVVRLDPTDALFVDVIHTNGGKQFLEGIGIDEPIGHVDFYPNGGVSQPGCSNSTANSTSMDDYDPVSNACSHFRAINLFTESVLSYHCRFEGTACESFESFIRGDCHDCRHRYHAPRRVEMGFHARKPWLVTHGQKYFLLTNANPPYCEKMNEYLLQDQQVKIYD